ncbi:MAG: type 4a pilus biogenesis protein PilO [Pseudomonadota bacterium]
MKLEVTKVDWNSVPTKKERIIFFIVIFLLLVVFLRSCLVPSGKALSLVKTSLTDVTTEQNELKKSLSEAAAEESVSKWNGSKDMREKYSSWARRIANSPEVVLLRDFTSPSILGDVKVTAFDFDESKPQDGIMVKKIKLSLNGSFFSIAGYFDKIEQLPLLLITESLDVVSSKDGFGRVDVNADMTVYGWKQ